MKKLFSFNLQLFSEGGGSGGEGGAGAMQGAESNQNQPSLGKKAKGETVIYGKQDNMDMTDDDNKGQAANDHTKTAADRAAEFDRLIKSDYKDLFDSRVQGIIDKRFKETKTLETQLGSISPVLEMVANKYGVEPEDIDSLVKAIEEDDAYWEELADEAGLTVEQYKYKQKLERENAQYNRMIQEQQMHQQTEQIYQGWVEASKEVQATYPDFNLETECNNKGFVDLISRGVDLKTAYEVTHMDDIKNSIAKSTKAATADTIRTNGQRPPENGVNSQPGVIIKADVGNLSRHDRAEIARRVARGEEIKF